MRVILKLTEKQNLKEIRQMDLLNLKVIQKRKETQMEILKKKVKLRLTD